MLGVAQRDGRADDITLVVFDYVPARKLLLRGLVMSHVHRVLVGRAIPSTGQGVTHAMSAVEIVLYHVNPLVLA